MLRLADVESVSRDVAFAFGCGNLRSDHGKDCLKLLSDTFEFSEKKSTTWGADINIVLSTIFQVELKQQKCLRVKPGQGVFA